MIVGAGLAGLIAAHAFHGMPLVEVGKRAESHKALLRFRTDAVSRLTGIPFRRVRVRKGLWHKGLFREPSVRLANLYAQKCMGHLEGGDRSIWNLEAVDRYIAPEDLYDRLVEQVGDRISWETEADFNAPGPIISTAPMPVTLRAVGIDSQQEFHRSPVTVERFRVHRCDLFQTIYFPDPDIPVYRASITGDLLIVEYAAHASAQAMTQEEAVECVLHAFGVADCDVQRIGAVQQRYGKIAPIDERARRACISRLTTERNIYSLGRFATWRNILLDDVVDDIAVIKRLIAAGDYDRRIAGA